MLNALQSRAGKNGVGAGGKNLRSALANQGIGGFDQRAGGIDDVVNDESAAAAHIADQVHHFGYVEIDATFIDDGQWRVEFLSEGTGAFHTTCVWRYDSQVGQLHVAEIIHQHG